MSIESKWFYWVTCDWEGCDASTQDCALAYEEKDAAGEAKFEGWLIHYLPDGAEGHYCLDHQHWSEDEEELLPGPYVEAVEL